MATDRISYEVLVQDALRNVIRTVLTDVAKSGLPGEHHFFITFLTNWPGVEISQRLKERYPEQMTIVLQNQFWDLTVTDKEFSVTLSFGDVPEYLKIPFFAIKGFYDPAAAFETSFDLPELDVSAFDGNDEAAYQLLDNDGRAPVIAVKKSDGYINELHEKKSNNEAVVNQEKSSADVVLLDSFRKK